MAGIGKYKKGAKFTLKSGNKVNFKEMGGSPAKQSSDLDTPDADAIRDRDRMRLLEAQYARQRAQDTQAAIANMESPDDRRKRFIDEEQRSRDITIPVATDDGVEQKVIKGEKMVEGEDYKTKEQLRQERKTRNVKRRQETERGSDERKQRRREDRTKTLEDRAKRERGTGKSRVTFDWRKAVLGGSSAAGIGHEAKYKSTEKRIARRKAKDEAKKIKEQGKKDRKLLRGK